MDESIELVRDGAETAVTLDNLQEYIDLVLHAVFHETVALQLQAFKKGFNSVLPIESLRPFQARDEVELLVCGAEPSGDEWADANLLRDLIKPDHGYSSKSRAYEEFLRFIVEMPTADRPLFVKWATGSRRLPLGGFAALEPRMSLNCKKPVRSDQTPDMILPSVSSCQHYVKMPEYSSYAILRARFELAVREGSENFTLS